VLRIRWSRKEEQLAVCEDAIYIEQHQFDFFGSRAGIWHARIVTKAAFSR
jgi:hypothetical protein